MTNLMKHGAWLAAGCLVAFGAACGGKANDTDTKADPAFVDGSPDFDGVSLELAGDDGASSDGTATSPLTDEGSLEQGLAADAPEFFPVVRSTVRGINITVARFVRRVEALVRANPTVATGTEHTWEGTNDGIDWRYSMKKLADKKFSFTLEAMKSDGADFVKVAEGEMAVGIAAHRGAGFIRVDLTAMNGIDPAKTPQKGALRVKYAHTLGIKKLWVKLEDYQKDAAAQKANAYYVYTLLGRGGAGGIRLAINANLNGDDPEKTAAEWLLIHGRWIRGFKARFDAVAFGGDIPANSWARGVECIANIDGNKVDYKRVVYKTKPSTGPVTTTVLREHGDVQACAPGLRTDPPESALPESQTEAETVASSDADVDAPAEN